jgi:hypothetical protein
LSDHDLLHALYVPFDRAHILINRTQCRTSVFAADVRASATEQTYYTQAITIGGIELAIFDLHTYLCETFHLQSPAAAQLVLIMPLARLSQNTRSALIEGPLSATDHEQVALRVSSETAMHSVHLNELRPLGVTMRKHLVAHGIVAAHPEQHSFGLLVDVDRLLHLSLGSAA